MVKLAYVVISAYRSVLADTETNMLSMVKHTLVKYPTVSEYKGMEDHCSSGTTSDWFHNFQDWFHSRYQNLGQVPSPNQEILITLYTVSVRCTKYLYLQIKLCDALP